MRIKHPVKSCLPSESGEYAFIIKDANNVEHFFNHNGTYDGFVTDVCITGKSMKESE